MIAQNARPSPGGQVKCDVTMIDCANTSAYAVALSRNSTSLHTAYTQYTPHSIRRLSRGHPCLLLATSPERQQLGGKQPISAIEYTAGWWTGVHFHPLNEEPKLLIATSVPATNSLHHASAFSFRVPPPPPPPLDAVRTAPTELRRRGAGRGTALCVAAGSPAGGAAGSTAGATYGLR